MHQGRRPRGTARLHARACVDCIHEAIHGFGVDAITVALVDGTALGGGLECALAHNYVVAERHVSCGFPEIKFNLFPGMGAYHLVEQRAGTRVAERMIGGGESYPAGKLAAEGLIDVVTDQGGGYGAVIDLIDNLRPRANGIRGMLRARQATHPVRREALMAVTEDWTEAAFTVGEDALAYMQRLVGLQDARVAMSRVFRVAQRCRVVRRSGSRAVGRLGLNLGCPCSSAPDARGSACPLRRPIRLLRRCGDRSALDRVPDGVVRLRVDEVADCGDGDVGDGVAAAVAVEGGPVLAGQDAAVSA